MWCVACRKNCADFIMIRAGSAPCIFIFAAYGLMVQCWSSETG
ncbi:hypothetical protein [Neisseria sicca]|nr:hypothetical protein [Neisseria sicca]